jgi:crossover junction endodeoxyribonuclease RuvC
VKIFGIDPGSERTGYGCVEMLGSRHRLVICGSLAAPARSSFPDRLKHIHAGLTQLLARARPDCVAVETIFHARNVRSALKLGHARGVALLAAAEAGLPVVEYAPAEIKRAVVGYGRAEKHQVQQMVRLLLGLEVAPSPHDVADALAVAICHLHSTTGAVADASRAAGARAVAVKSSPSLRSWRDYRP